MSSEPKRAESHLPSTLERAKGWQPIETAPKDGTLVLLWARDLGSRDSSRVTIGRYNPRQYGLSINDEKSIGWASVEEEIDGSEEFGFGMIPKEIVPSHWMPLPAPP